ncbi:IS66 family transposase [Streptomyces gibsoniae]|uniref:Transposase n=1 Tax=Streptomyces gibsoniae TaxID=3075529 RepID=A0ABU2U8P8_9ACTN|nr:transposase [Streptomyces sp. DSM 41699]MDT0469610.1 transposase [Streptomyces sp. DSM 41699]
MKLTARPPGEVIKALDATVKGSAGIEGSPPFREGSLQRGCAGTAHARYEEIIAAGRVLHPAREPGTRRVKRSKAANLLDRLDTERDQVLRFAFDWRVPFDNNGSEQMIRMAKIQQKISGGWRTARGAERFFAVRGYLSTAAKQGKNLLDAITRLFDGRGAWIPAPAG